MNVRYTVGVNEYKRMITQVRDAFLVDVFEGGALNMIYCEVERSIVGAAIPMENAEFGELGKSWRLTIFVSVAKLGF